MRRHVRAPHDQARTQRRPTDPDDHGALEVRAPRDQPRAADGSPPQTQHARLRGQLTKRAKERKRDYTVDWVHLKLNDQAQRTVLCKDPFKSRDERVEKLIASL